MLGSAANCCRHAASLTTATPGSVRHHIRGEKSAADFRLHLKNVEEVGGSPQALRGTTWLPRTRFTWMGT